MAERTIGLKIELNGFRGVITNIKQLEDEIRKAKEDLQELEIGSSLFSELTGQIQRAETEMGKLRKQTEGISTEKQAEGFGKLAAGITSGFAAATAAVSLFGNESEEMSKAAVQAQNLITVALSARGIIEIQTGAKIVATTIATKAEAAASLFAAKSTNIFNTSMKGLFTTIAANPMGALVTVIGLAITALVAFSSEADDAAKSQEDFNKALRADISKGVTNTKLLVNTINNTSLSLNTRKKALDDLQKDFPAYFENLKQEDILSGKVKIATDQLTAAIVAQAKARALEGRIEERYTKQLDLEAQLEDATRKRIKAEKDLKDVQNAGPVYGGGGITSGQVTSRGQEEVITGQRLNRLKEEEANLQKQLNTLNKEQMADEKKIQDLMLETDKVIGKTTEDTKKDTDAKKKNVEMTE
jgi:hypothetical protein